ncbi:hypothetical protein YTPLAS21_19570 [Candidatus Nitrosocosmicus sp.]|nr:hypothetical protein YTPLAS21_19570 [Candidatus Nitrosocosmicus sp.]
MATNNQINVPLSGVSIGSSGVLVGTNTPTLVTPDLGVATATSLNFGASSTTGQVGTATNNNAAAGYVGEYVSSSVPEGSAVNILDNVAKDVTSISLEAGDWELSATVFFKPAAGTTSSTQASGISLVSNTINGTDPGYNYLQQPITGSPQKVSTNSCGNRLSLSGTTTVYLVAFVRIAVSTMSVYGFIGARRVR